MRSNYIRELSVFFALWATINSAQGQVLEWDHVLSGHWITAVVESSAGTLYAGSVEGRLFTSDDDGLTWEALSYDFQMEILHIEIDSDSLIYVGTAGPTFVARPLTSTTDTLTLTHVSDMVSLQPQRVLALNPSGVHLSRDSGQTFEVVFVPENGFGATLGRSLVTDSTIFIGTAGGLEWQSGSLHASEDAGGTWRHLLELPTTSALQLPGGRIVTAGNLGVNFTDDGGATWQQSLDIRGSVDIDALVYLNGRLFVSQNESSIAESADGGNTWSSLSQGQSLNQHGLIATGFGHLIRVSRLGLFRSVLPVVTNIQRDDHLVRRTSVFPNPVDERLYVQTSYARAGGLIFTMYDMVGREVLTVLCKEDCHSSGIDVGALRHGVYLYTVRGQDATQSVGSIVVAR